MSYVSNFGESGPIKINNTWLRELLKSSPEEPKKETKDGEVKNIDIYFGFSLKKTGSVGDYRKLLAGTPVIGTYTGQDEDGNDVTRYYAPDNAVVTVEWLSAALSGMTIEGGGSFDPSKYASGESVRELETKVIGLTNRMTKTEQQVEDGLNRIVINEEMIASLRENISTIDSNIDEVEEDIVEVQNTLEKLWLTGLVIECGWT